MVWRRKVGQLLFDHLPTAARRMTEQDALCGAKEHAEVKDIQSLTHRNKKDDVPVDHTQANSRQGLCGDIPPGGGMGDPGRTSRRLVMRCMASPHATSLSLPCWT